MDNNVYWNLELEIQSGADQELGPLMEEMVEATRENEPGTLNYEWSTSEDRKYCHIFERYTDSDAVMIHLSTFGEKFAERFLALLKPVRFTVYGSPSADVKEALAGLNPVYMKRVGGFSR